MNTQNLTDYDIYKNLTEDDIVDWIIELENKLLSDIDEIIDLMNALLVYRCSEEN